METRLKVLGHPVHPMLVVYPLALFSIALLFDLGYVVTGVEELAAVAFWNITAGLVLGVVAALFGLLDWLAIPRGTRAKSVGMWHGGGNAVIVVLFALSWLMRSPAAYLPNILPFLLALVGVGLALVTAWLGGELVYRLRVGVDDDAGLNASNSLAEDGLVTMGTDTTGRAA